MSTTLEKVLPESTKRILKDRIIIILYETLAMFLPVAGQIIPSVTLVIWKPKASLIEVKYIEQSKVQIY